MAMLAAFLAAQFALVFAGSHGSKVTLELIDNMKLPATYNQFTKSQVLPAITAVPHCCLWERNCIAGDGALPGGGVEGVRDEEVAEAG